MTDDKAEESIQKSRTTNDLTFVGLLVGTAVVVGGLYLWLWPIVPVALFLALVLAGIALERESLQWVGAAVLAFVAVLMVWTGVAWDAAHSPGALIADQPWVIWDIAFIVIFAAVGAVAVYLAVDSADLGRVA